MPDDASLPMTENPVKTTMKFPVSALALLALAACGDGANNSSNEAGSTRDAAPALQESPATANPHTTKAPDVRQVLQAKLSRVAPRNFTSSVPPVSEQGVRGDVVLAVLTQLDQTSSGAAPLELGYEPVSEVQGIQTHDKHALGYRSTLDLGTDAGNALGEFVRTSTGGRFVTDASFGGPHSVPTSVAFKYGFSVVQNRLDRRRGDVIVIGKQAEVRNESYHPPTSSATASSAATLNIHKIYNFSSPLQTWTYWTSGQNWEFRLSVSVREPVSDQRLILCERLSHNREASPTHHPYLQSRAYCTHWQVPEGWKFPQPLKLVNVIADQQASWLSQTSDNDPGFYVTSPTYWSTNGLPN